MSARRALLIACARYDDPLISGLRSPVHDIDGVGAVLADPAVGGFTVTKLIDEPEPVVRRRLGRFLLRSAPTDVLVVYFAGHGFKDDDGSLYLAARDTELSEVVSTALPADVVRRLFDLAPSRRTVLVLDCCYSGAITRQLSSREVDLVQVGDALGSRAEGRVIITASRATEYAYEPGHSPIPLRQNELYSVFAEAFIEGLRTGDADLDGDGLISVSELYDYIHARITRSWSAQTPGIWNQVTGKLFVARRTAADGPAPTAAKASPRTTRTPYDATVVNWRFGLTPTLLAGFATAGPSAQRAWRAAGQQDWAAASRFFSEAAEDDPGNPAPWWGRALAGAVEADWRAAGTCFARAAELTPHDQPAMLAGSSLLAAATLFEARDPVWHEPLENLLERVPTCPEALAFRGVRLDDDTALRLALELMPELVDDFAAIGESVLDLAAAAIAETERRVAVLVRATTTARAVLDAIAPAAGPRPAATAPGAAKRDVAERLHDAQRSIATYRRELVQISHRLDEAVEGLLERSAADTARFALVAAIREASNTIIAALRETDRPPPVHASGIPPRIIQIA